MISTLKCRYEITIVSMTMSIYTYGRSGNNTQKVHEFFDLNSSIILSSPSTLRDESYKHVAVKVSYHGNMYFEQFLKPKLAASILMLVRG